MDADASLVVVGLHAALDRSTLKHALVVTVLPVTVSAVEASRGLSQGISSVEETVVGVVDETLTIGGKVVTRFAGTANIQGT